MGKIYGELERAQLENIAAPTPGLRGRVYADSSTNDPSYDNGTIINKILMDQKETSFSLSNNQAATDVTGLVFSSANFHRAKIEFAIRRRDDTAEQDAVGVIYVVFKKDAATWDLSVEFSGDAESGRPAGTTFSITAAGQIQYSTVDFNGGVGANYAGYLRFDVVKKYANFAT